MTDPQCSARALGLSGGQRLGSGMEEASLVAVLSYREVRLGNTARNLALASCLFYSKPLLMNPIHEPSRAYSINLALRLQWLDMRAIHFFKYT